MKEGIHPNYQECTVAVLINSIKNTEWTNKKTNKRGWGFRTSASSFVSEEFYI